MPILRRSFPRCHRSRSFDPCTFERGNEILQSFSWRQFALRNMGRQARSREEARRFRSGIGREPTSANAGGGRDDAFHPPSWIAYERHPFLRNLPRGFGREGKGLERAFLRFGALASPASKRRRSRSGLELRFHREEKTSWWHTCCGSLRLGSDFLWMVTSRASRRIPWLGPDREDRDLSRTGSFESIGTRFYPYDTRLQGIACVATDGSSWNGIVVQHLPTPPPVPSLDRQHSSLARRSCEKDARVERFGLSSDSMRTATTRPPPNCIQKTW